MIPFLLYHPKTRPTGRALAKLLGIGSGTRCAGRKNEIFSHIIRWGNIREVSATFRVTNQVEPNTWIDGAAKIRHRAEINTREAVALAGSKFRSLQTLQTAGVPVPEFHRGDGRVENIEGIWLLRSFRHSRGTDIEIRDFTGNVTRYSRADYLIKYIKPHKEYRVHVMRGRILFAQKKYFREQLFEEIYDGYLDRGDNQLADEFQTEAQIIRNNEHGWGFHDMENINNVPAAVQDASIRAVNALGLDFGAVDVISTEKQENGKRGAFVLEVNTAPGLRDRNLQKYANDFIELFGVMP